MRIISGTARGHKLFGPASTSREIRPTSERAREALFSILGERVVNAQVLDLFAGTGALGCEALSRGAACVWFVDASRTALSLIEKNIRLIPDGPARSVVLRQDLRNGLGSRLLARSAQQPFDLIFADPPYLKGLSESVLNMLDSHLALCKNTLVVVEEKKQANLPDELQNLARCETRRYGDSVFAFYRLRQTDHP